MKQRTGLWKAVEYPAMQHLSLHEDDRTVQIEGVVVGADEAGIFRLDYQITCDAGYVVREAKLNLAGGQKLHLKSDGHGNWSDSDDKPLPDLKGCIDIDITATPFTNTLPIKRLNWKPGQSETFHMVYFLIPEMTFYVDEQRYTCIEQHANGAIFRFDQISTGFTALLLVDADGLVLDYPDLFERVKR